METLRKWNRFLNNCGLPEVDVVGTGLPDALRNRLSIAAATIVEMSRADFASWSAKCWTTSSNAISRCRDGTRDD